MLQEMYQETINSDYGLFFWRYYTLFSPKPFPPLAELKRVLKKVEEDEEKKLIHWKEASAEKRRLGRRITDLESFDLLISILVPIFCMISCAIGCAYFNPSFWEMPLYAPFFFAIGCLLGPIVGIGALVLTGLFLFGPLALVCLLLYVLYDFIRDRIRRRRSA